MGADPPHEYPYSNAQAPHTHAYLWPVVFDLLKHTAPNARRVLDAGCGNGSMASQLKARGHEVSAFDLSDSGIRLAKEAHPGIDFRVASVYDDLRPHYSQPFDAIVSLEVVEHLFDPRTYARRMREVIAPGGTFILSTPYHGYLKNLALATTGAMDKHFTVLWDGGHIKFWSRKTLTMLLEEAGFRVVAFRGAGRAPYLWKSMVLAAQPR